MCMSYMQYLSSSYVSLKKKQNMFYPPESETKINLIPCIGERKNNTLMPATCSENWIGLLVYLVFRELCFGRSMSHTIQPWYESTDIEYRQFLCGIQKMVYNISIFV